MPDVTSLDWSKFLESPPGKIGLLVAAVLIGLGILRLLWKWIRKSQQVTTFDPALSIQLEAPPEQRPAFPVYVRNLPSRLVAVIVAPLGVQTPEPTIEQVPGLVDRFIPGLSKAIPVHQSLVKIWPRQLSHTGFGHALVRNVHIPGREWRGSSWSLVCGPGFLDGQRFVIGLVMVSDTPNNMDLTRVQRDGEWPSIVHIDASQTRWGPA